MTTFRSPRELMLAGCMDPDTWSAELRKAAARCGSLDDLDLFVWFSRAMQARNHVKELGGEAANRPSTQAAPTDRVADAGKAGGAMPPEGAHDAMQRVVDGIKNAAQRRKQAAKAAFVQCFLLMKRNGGSGVGHQDAEFAAKLYDQTLAVAGLTE